MTAQEIFDRVWRHFVTEGNPRSLGDDGMCAYRGQNGTRCAVGVLIPDGEYTSALDTDPAGTSVMQMLGRPTCPPSLATLRGHVELLMSLQWAHDNHEDADIKDALREVADAYGLAVPS